jgi:hypothetical protein
MRADNTEHLKKAAAARYERTRRKAVDASTGSTVMEHRSPLLDSHEKPALHAHGSTPSPTCWPASTPSHRQHDLLQPNAPPPAINPGSCRRCTNRLQPRPPARLPEPGVTGTRAFHIDIIARLALSGIPVALYTADPRESAALANHAAPQQFRMRPTNPPPRTIVVGDDGSSEIPSRAVTVTLRRPQSAHAPSTTIVITQDTEHPYLLHITTAHGRQSLSTRLAVNHR